MNDFIFVQLRNQQCFKLINKWINTAASSFISILPSIQVIALISGSTLNDIKYLYWYWLPKDLLVTGCYSVASCECVGVSRASFKEWVSQAGSSCALPSGQRAVVHHVLIFPTSLSCFCCATAADDLQHWRFKKEDFNLAQCRTVSVIAIGLANTHIRSKDQPRGVCWWKKLVHWVVRNRTMMRDIIQIVYLNGKPTLQSFHLNSALLFPLICEPTGIKDNSSTVPNYFYTIMILVELLLLFFNFAEKTVWLVISCKKGVRVFSLDCSPRL